jgi:VanZ family protein
MFRLPRHPAVWFSALLCWGGFLWFLSDQPGSDEPFPVDHFDKVMHFTYFMGGGILLGGFLLRLAKGSPVWKRLIVTTVVVMTIIGAADEYHQSFTPHRSGNDPWDLLADILGASAGAFAVRAVHSRKRGNQASASSFRK